jgi:hypothetical protein
MNLDNGFMIVASGSKDYVDGANFCAGSIKDNYPGAHITLVVPPVLLEYVDKSNFDIIISDEDVPNHSRTKLYGLSKTPYTNLTVYVDADMECWHPDVATIWDEMPNDADILITKIRPYNGKISKWPTGEMIYHGGFFMYRNNPHTMLFMEKWYTEYLKQKNEPWPYPEHEIPKDLRPWDQFTFWKMMNIDKMEINVQVFKDDARWNFVNGYFPSETDKDIIFWHHTLPSRRGN